MKIDLKVLLLTVVIYFSKFQSLKSQEISLTKYYDSLWFKTKKESAFYFCDFQKTNYLYLCECYWNSSNKLRSVSMKEKMTLNSKTSGLEMKYFESGKVESSTLFDENGIRINSYNYYDNGQISDSIFYNENNIIDSAFHYFENGKLRAIYYSLKGNKKDSLFAFNSKGENVINVVYFKEATFKNGSNDWLNYIKENLNPNIAIDNNAPKGEYTVLVSYTIGKDGLISDVKAKTNHGYGMEEGVIRMIKNSPNWVPEVFLGETQSVVRTQPVTYTVEEYD